MSALTKLQNRRSELESRFDAGEINETVIFQLREIDRKIFKLLCSDPNKSLKAL